MSRPMPYPTWSWWKQRARELPATALHVVHRPFGFVEDHTDELDVGCWCAPLVFDAKRMRRIHPVDLDDLLARHGAMHS